MQTFQHLFLNIPFNVMLALFKIAGGKASKRCRQSIALPPAKGRRAGTNLKWGENEHELHDES
jgi:hypothetical protein